MRKLVNKKSGFTLIELMIVVAILGILAAVAIPAFSTYLRRAKTVEATEALAAMFTSVASYYDKSFYTAADMAGVELTHCVVAAADDGKTPTDQKLPGTYDTNSFNSASGLGYTPSGPGYYNLSIASGIADTCLNAPAAATVVYTLSARGDLDHDAVYSTFAYLVGANANNSLYHAPSPQVTNETE